MFGTKFVLAFPQSLDVVSSSSHYLHIGNPSDIGTVVTVGNGTSYTTHTIGRKDYMFVTVNIEEMSGNERALGKTIVVTSTEEIYIIAETESAGHGTKSWFVVHPVDTLGTQYILVNSKANLDVDSIVTVVATEADTNITLVNPTWNPNQLYAPSDTTNLAQYEAFQALTTSTANTIRGIRVQANKPIVVIAGSRGNGGTTVSSFEQIPSQETFGMNFVLFKRQANCITTESGGSIEVQNTVTVSVSDSNYHIEQATDSAYGITSTKPLLCSVLSINAESDTKMTIIPPRENWSNSYEYSNFLNMEFVINIAIKAGTENQLIITTRTSTVTGDQITWTSVTTPNSE